MAVHPVRDMATHYAHNRQRRSATSVCAGAFDSRRPYERDVLTSVLNGVPKYPAVEKVEEDEERRARKQEKKEREQVKKRAKPGPKHVDKTLPVASGSGSASAAPAPTAKRPTPAPRPPPPTTTSAFWIARPVVHIATMQRSLSVTPPPPSSPPSTPGPSMSSSTSRTSSKRPRTPDDGEDIDDRSSRSMSTDSSTPPPRSTPRQRKKRMAARKGWKGWVEGSPPPSDKLINLDVVTVLTERTTRSGKNFDGASEQKDYWI